MVKKATVLTCFLIVGVGCFLHAQTRVTDKKLIEFGWDYPNVASLKTNYDQRQKTPFDGVFFSFDSDIYAAFDTTLFPDSKFKYTDLTKIEWGKFTDNFLLVRGAGHTGPHWLDDKSWENISQNIKKISKALSLSKSKGIGFDAEYYFKDTTLNPWKYRPSWYNNLSYKDVGSYVRKRGKQFMQALQAFKPDVKVFCFWLLGLVNDQNKTNPIEKTSMALYPFFIEGMLEGKNNSSEIIDGNESSYTYQSFVPFISVGENIRKHQSRLISKSLQNKYNNISIAQAVYLDVLYAKIPKFEKGFNKQTKEQWLRDNLYYAFKTTDKYVWFYNERIDWWKNKVDSGLTDIINEVKNKINAELNNNSPRINGYSLARNFKNKEQDNYRAISYTYQKDKNQLDIKILKDDVKQLLIYNNSHLIYNNDSPPPNLTISLKNKYAYKGNLIIMVKDGKGKSSVSFVN
jgi:hypothetical protein